ncbi:MAG: hypothetical protein IJW55_05145 [Clostridia bacterium]|nr:hypothetical protein [Clostridia bacterium]
MKILFIGNSYTYYNNLPKLLEALTLVNGKDFGELPQKISSLGLENAYADQIRSVIE